MTLEGGEGAGKSTLLPILADWLTGGGKETVATREPGGTPNGEAVRALVLSGAADRWSPAAELMLMNAARLDHHERVIRPALDRGAVVLCDRYVDSTRVYQGLVGGFGLATVDRLHRELLGLPWPDATLLLDLDPALGLERRGSTGAAGRFEAKGLGFHEQVRLGFRALAEAEPRRFTVLDAGRRVQEVAAAACAALRSRLGLRV